MDWTTDHNDGDTVIKGANVMCRVGRSAFKIVCTWFCMGVFCLILQGQGLAGERFTYQGYTGEWIGNGVPAAGIPPGKPGGCVGTHANVATGWGGCCDGGGASYWYAYGCVYYVCVNRTEDACGQKQWLAYVYTMNNNDGDYDGDGILDSVDPDPFVNDDTDGDGVDNDEDPWPDDEDCPGSGPWERMYTARHKTEDCSITFYNDSSGNCGVVSSESGAGCGSVTDWEKMDDFDVRFYVGDSGEWSDYFPPSGGGPTGSEAPDPATKTEAGDTGQVKALREMVEGLSGLGGKLDNIYARQNSNTDTLVSKLNDIIAKGSEIKTAVENVSVNVNTSGIESRIDSTNTKLDTANTKLSSIDTKLGEIKDSIPLVGDTMGLPDGGTSAFENESVLGESIIEGYTDTAKGALGAVFDWALANHPLFSLLTGTSFAASGSMSFQWDMGTYGIKTVDATPYIGFLEIIGGLLVGLASLWGMAMLFEK